MDDVARLPVADRTDLFVVTGTGRGLISEMIEKDFWVCWTLKRLFTLPDPHAGFALQGRHLTIQGVWGHRAVFGGH